MESTTKSKMKTALVLLASLTLASARLNTTHQRRSTQAHHNLARHLSEPVRRALPGTWAAQGCWTDSVAARTLAGATYADPAAMTHESCVAFCDAARFVYAGTEYAQECFCGNALLASSSAAPAADCAMACTGDAGETCGGPNRLSLFASGAPPPAGPVTNPGVGGWVSAGCYTDGPDRTLPNQVGVTGAMTVAKCTAACAAAEYAIAGVEYAQECYCANAFENGGAPAPDGCTMPCAGDAGELCGGAFRLNVYTLGGGGPPPPADGWAPLGCYTDAVAARTLGVGQPTGGANTVAACQAACAGAGYPLAGVEYAVECYCDTELRNGGGPAPDGDAGCDMPCAGDADEICGGPNRLNVFRYSGTLPTGPGNGGGGGGGGGGGNGAVGPVTGGLPAPWHYAGCWVDNAHGRILGAQQPDDGTLTVAGCVGTCAGLGYALAGAEFGVQCFCGGTVINGGELADADAECAMACGGAAGEACGGPNRMSIYATGDVVALPVPVPQTAGLPGQWAYQGCIAENGAVRTFPYMLTLLEDNSAATCLALCSKYGYPAAGLEYSEQCFCGDVGDVATNGAVPAPEADCSMPCTGDPVHLCGGPNRLSYYAWQGALNDWKTPANAGRYEFLIGGVVIPLVTALGTNNKVTFVEKFGTGPPNSTGAYELDLSLVDDFGAAWRTMHVKSDVFCSGGLTLPDRVGRQLNVGGWSLESTYGIRLYWPDGAPGQPSTHDWEENYAEVALQIGRWYPGAMVMANGSILVVGGEDGSNGPPVPSLEVLPKPAGGPTLLTMDWLARTDPNNLYPFLFVLPGGGVLVVYYNEARILDEATFATVAVLPNLPGAVNDGTAGRTYPLEGTAVLLPQRAPYAEPVTVMACGGSTLGPAVALDNCVSIQPEVAGAQWLIERMPSKRVMTCMVTLPDGTYLILNGAQQGVAGFGLATDPNLRAVLYDPAQPAGARFSVLATTIVARMYHSEAILLQDARVLVSGSDPEDARFPQEYRVEVFVPPYLAAGLAQPTFTLAETDWAYGGQYAVQVVLHQGSAATMRVSLVAAVTSTHGNSMNQRILFPAFTCAGNACTITAPPNAHVCPPGWFQLFVLDGPTPSWSTWVRIGGDPAQLGNWPPFPDFSLPGL